jgi:hypothetical protein
MRLWTDIAESVNAAGIHKLVLFNAHGGHVGAMDVVSRDLRARLGMLVYSVSWYQLPLLNAEGKDLNALFSDHEHRFGVHAGEVETSVMLALKPESVQMDKAQNFQSTSEERATKFSILGNGKSAKLAWQMQDYNAAGAAGNAVASALSSFSGKSISSPKDVKFEIAATGPGASPKFKIVKVDAGNVKSQAKEAVADKIQAAKAEAEAKARAEAERLKKEAESKAKAETDRLKKEAEDKAKGELEKLKKKFKF